MNDKFTKKEIQLFKIIHTLRKFLKKGEIKITFHNYDVDMISEARADLRLDGKEENGDFITLLTKVFDFDNIEENTPN